MRDRELVEGARAIALDMQLPSGRQAKLARVIDRHLPWFEAARARGCGWDDIIEMLFVAGAKRVNGQRLTRGHVSSLVWRKLKAAPNVLQSKPASLPDQRPCHGKELPARAPVKTVLQSEGGNGTMPIRLSPARQAERLPSPQRSRSFAEAKPLDRANGTGNAAGGDTSTSPITETRVLPGSQATLEYMRRSAALRQGRDDG